MIKILKNTSNQPLTINLVSFDVPFPPNYGGAIDVFYKLKALSLLGVKIHLHTFEYGRGKQIELEKYCEKVYYYPRKSFLISFFSKTPFIVKSRENNLLEKRLVENTHPVLFEGLHSVCSINKLSKTTSKIIVRNHNIEHHYYNGLAKSETNFLKKIFFKIEALKLRKYESILKKANHILSISPIEQEYYHGLYHQKSSYIPVFFQDEFTKLEKEHHFILWHGDLRVSDNVKSALMAIDIVQQTPYKLIIASSAISDLVMTKLNSAPNIFFNNLQNENELDNLLATAKINLLFTFQQTGIKLKLLNALVKSRFIITNNLMVEQTGLAEACIVTNSKNEIIDQLNKHMKLSFSKDERLKRIRLLKKFDTKKNAQKIIDLLLE